MDRKRCIAMILAGGQGSRLGVLTKNNAKPVVNFGGKYKLIDFPLSNCIQSGIDTVGVLTQYQPLELNAYIGAGQPWDLDRNDGGIFLLPPYMSGEHDEWYKGTANAIYQNIYFVDQFQPDNVLVLPGDHIYKMDYKKMLDKHIASDADLTISVTSVAIEEASRFGIMSIDENERVTKFTEKPKQPESNLASMGIYIFKWQALKKYLIIDESNKKSENDFGRNLIPAMLAAGEKIFTYNFNGYWRDVGTIESLWEANMDLLSNNPDLDLYEKAWKIFTRPPHQPPHYIAKYAKVRQSIISEGCNIYGEVERSVLFDGVIVEEGAIIKDSVIMHNVVIGRNVTINKSIIDSNTVIGDNAVIGVENGINSFVNPNICTEGISLIAQSLHIGENVNISPNSMVTHNVEEVSFADVALQIKRKQSQVKIIKWPKTSPDRAYSPT